MNPHLDYCNRIYPELKNYIKRGNKNMLNHQEKVICDYNPDDHKFEKLDEFKFYVSCGANTGFEFSGVKYIDRYKIKRVE